MFHILNFQYFPLLLISPLLKIQSESHQTFSLEQTISTLETGKLGSPIPFSGLSPQVISCPEVISSQDMNSITIPCKRSPTFTPGMRSPYGFPVF